MSAAPTSPVEAHTVAEVVQDATSTPSTHIMAMWSQGRDDAACGLTLDDIVAKGERASYMWELCTCRDCAAHIVTTLRLEFDL